MKASLLGQSSFLLLNTVETFPTTTTTKIVTTEAEIIETTTIVESSLGISPTSICLPTKQIYRFFFCLDPCDRTYPSIKIYPGVMVLSDITNANVDNDNQSDIIVVLGCCLM